jgi:predicted nucleic acid-binding protein
MDTMLTLAEDSVHEILWSDALLDEWERVIVRENARSAESAAKITAVIRDHFPEGRIPLARYIGSVASMPGNDPDDRHHMAAAIAGGADSIVTWNRKDFPGLELAKRGVRVLDPDEYLMEVLRDAPVEVLMAIQRMAARKRRPPMTVSEVVDRLAAAQASNFAVRVRDLLALAPVTESGSENADTEADRKARRSGWLRPHEVRVHLSAKRPPPYDVRLRVPKHEPHGRNAHSRFLESTMTEIIEHWPPGTVMIIDYRNRTYAQVLSYPPHILTEIGPVNPERMTAAVAFGWMDPAAFHARHADFESQPVWKDNPVREWEYGIDSLHEVGLFIQGSIQSVLGVDIGRGYRTHIFNERPEFWPQR